jgi:hypothetical protein
MHYLSLEMIVGFSNILYLIFFPAVQQPNAGQGRLILDVSGSQTVTHHS